MATSTSLSVIEKAIESNIGRVVAFVITPVVATVVGVVSLWLTKNLGVHVDPAQATAFVVTTVGGFVLLAFKWLENRGKFEAAAAAAVAEVEAARKAAEDAK